MGLLVRAACLVLAGWFEGPAALAAHVAGVGPVLRLPLQGAEAIAKVSVGR